MKQRILIPLIAALIAIFVGGTFIPAWSAEVKRMDKDELKRILNNDNTYVLDVRSGRDWKSSEFKIQGAVRTDPGSVAKWASGYPKTGTLVLYCA